MKKKPVISRTGVVFVAVAEFAPKLQGKKTFSLSRSCVNVDLACTTEWGFPIDELNQKLMGEIITKISSPLKRLTDTLEESAAHGDSVKVLFLLMNL